ncbi:hypothetical protein R3P38DRAFT_2769912 [Favolaschia claudopus]|uniref:Uncharacterized protein n=1 Tax=Favolaschia claudopus TaxID=2862362 RepID=A0AAW0CJG9_9AGAR
MYESAQQSRTLTWMETNIRMNYDEDDKECRALPGWEREVPSAAWDGRVGVYEQEEPRSSTGSDRYRYSYGGAGRDEEEAEEGSSISELANGCKDTEKDWQWGTDTRQMVSGRLIEIEVLLYRGIGMGRWKAATDGGGNEEGEGGGFGRRLTQSKRIQDVKGLGEALCEKGGQCWRHCQNSSSRAQNEWNRLIVANGWNDKGVTKRQRGSSCDEERERRWGEATKTEGVGRNSARRKLEEEKRELYAATSLSKVMLDHSGKQTRALVMTCSHLEGPLDAPDWTRSMA